MKLRCERDVLAEALATAGRAVASRGALPVLSGVRLELAGDRLTVTGSDLELTITVELTVAGLADGVAVVPSRLVNDIVKALEPGAVELETGDDEARIASGRSEFSLRTLPADEFPRVATVEGDEVRFEADALVGALRQVLPAASGDDNRPILTGVLLAAEERGLRLVATDSYRLAVRDLPGVSVLSSGGHVLVPSRALAELSRSLGDGGELTLRLGERDASFASRSDTGGIVLTTRLIEGDYPNYQGLIPQNQPNRLTVAREPLMEALRRVKLLARDATPVRLLMSADGLELKAVTQDVGEGSESLDAAYEGEELTVAFNPDYLLAGVEAASGEEITLSTMDSLKPAVVRTPASDDYLYLLMPVRVQ
ncbi:MAG TPA: DNA polymerase III subunit beta [Acidimicrobiales bacterium]|nr:DNA polymerase III subunit beta [Acidimicrobiales bacterium]